MDDIYEVVDRDYHDLLKHYKIEKIEARLVYWIKRIDSVINDLQMRDKVRLNRTALYYFICDYFQDIVRLKNFHPVENANLKKILAYGSYWFLRKHPVQIIDDNIDKKGLFINEKIVISVIFSCIQEDGGIDDISDVLIAHFMYVLKYRIYTAQSIELFIDGIMRGKELKPKVSNDELV